MYTRGGKSTVEKPTLVNKPKIYKGRLGEVREANLLSPNRQCSSTCRFTPLVLAKCSEIDRRTEYRLYAFGLRQENINIYVM